MYSLNARKSAIKEIKKYLYFVREYVYPEITKTPIDSVYDKNTASAVKTFQKNVGLDASGEVDFLTFNTLYSTYKNAIDNKTASNYILTDDEFPFMPGNIGEDIRIINMLINQLSLVYSEIESVGNGNYYSKKTEDAVRILRRIFMMQDAEYVDKTLYTRMKKELDAHKRNTFTNDLKS